MFTKLGLSRLCWAHVWPPLGPVHARGMLAEKSFFQKTSKPGDWKTLSYVIVASYFEEKKPPKLHHRFPSHDPSERSSWHQVVGRETGASIERAPAMATAGHSSGTRGSESHSLRGTKDSMAPAPGGPSHGGVICPEQSSSVFQSFKSFSILFFTLLTLPISWICFYIEFECTA